ELGRVPLRKAHAEDEVLVFAVAELLQSVAQSEDGRRGPPGLGQRPDLDRTRRGARRSTRRDSGQHQASGETCQVNASAAHRARAGAGSASSASTIASARGLSQSRNPTASATARPSRAIRNVVGRPTTPYSVLILPSTSGTSGKVRPRSPA